MQIELEVYAQPKPDQRFLKEGGEKTGLDHFTKLAGMFCWAATPDVADIASDAPTRAPRVFTLGFSAC